MFEGNTNQLFNDAGIGRWSFELNSLVCKLCPVATRMIFDNSSEMKDCQIMFKILQVLNNYLSNSAKFSPKGTSVLVSVKKTSDTVRVTVKDQGRGIAIKDQQLLFTRYSRLDHQSAVMTKGFGLGLFLSKEILTMHGGSVGVTSKPGSGSSFYFILPLHSSCF